MHCCLPFDSLYISPYGYFPCCPDWLHPDHILRDTGYVDPWMVWNSTQLQELRKITMDGKCQNCLITPENPRYPDHKIIMERGPLHLFLANDWTCNLHCWSCRNPGQTINLPANTETMMYRFLDTFTADMQSVCVSCNGDPFASPIHLKLLQNWSYPAKVQLFTNGLLLPRYWHTLKCQVDWIYMSIDAATKETYEKLRRGARWEQLLETLTFLRDSNVAWQANMVVQRSNIHEVHRFVELMSEFNVTKIMLTLLRQWPHMSQPEFFAESVVHGDRSAYEELLTDPILQIPKLDCTFNDEVIVRLGR